MLNFKRFFLLGCIWGVFGICSLAAQSTLERISLTERGDGNGYVLRFHLTEMAGTYELIQPEVNRVQMQLFLSGLETEVVEMPDLNNEIIGVDLIALEGGVGVDITTANNVFFIAEAYPDQNMRDLLVNLEYATRADAEENALASNLYEWSLPEEAETVVEVEEETEPEPKPESELTTNQTDENIQPEEVEEEDRRRVVQRDPISVRIGLSGGIGIADKLGGNYTSESRQELVMGLSAGISLPFVLPLSIKTGIETGVYFVQKGFLTTSSNRFDGQTILLDYVEVPILARLNYDLTNAIKPKLVGGFYTDFRANAEVVQNDGDRNNLNSVTRPVDFGLIAGFGSDFIVESTNISLEVRYGVGLSPLFIGDFSGNERLSYLTFLMGIRF